MAEQEPSVSYDRGTYTVKLFRKNADGHEEQFIHIFGEHDLEVCSCLPEELASWERMRIQGPVSDDNKLYYLIAEPDDVGLASFVWIKDRSEALILRKKLQESTSCKVCLKRFCWGH